MKGITARTRITFVGFCNDRIRGNDKEGNSIECTLPDSPYYKTLPHILHKGCKLNILSATTDTAGVLHPRDIIYEPDYLIDISALARCIQPYGAPPIGYILNMLEPVEENAARLLGEAANMFLDACVNESENNPTTYARAILDFFREYPLQLSVCKEIDRKFFTIAQEQFNNIQMKAGRHAFSSDREANGNNLFLEPSFFCEPLGLQGRIDLLLGDYSQLIELKSGKADEFRRCAKEEHLLQMSLYKEMLIYCLGIERKKIRPQLLYSRYPLSYEQESTPQQISRALMLRNRIVALMQQMSKDGLRDILEKMTPNDLNETGTTSRLWNNYIRPRIERILTPVQTDDKELSEYIFGNIAFVTREMMLAKAGDIRSFSNVWNNDTESKLQEGNILIDLQIKSIKENDGISDITFTIPDNRESHFPNFRAGDTVFIYRRDTPQHFATNNRVIRGTLTEITPRELTLHLRHKQRNGTQFTASGLYAIEHDHLDSTFRASLRDLYSLLISPQERIDLLLARRMPSTDKSRTLNGNYGSRYINDIVLKAKQANELFMLVGPPGTGKTSHALGSMVRETVATGETNILLASYTNRAVDEICQTLENLPEKPQYIRIGNEQSCQCQYHPRLLKNVIAHCKNRDEIRSTIKSVRIFVGTTASLTARKELFVLKKFGTAIIDEATQILESQMAGLLAATTPDGSPAIEKFILIGDPKQLPAVVSQPAGSCNVTSKILNSIGIYNYGTSLFERLYRLYTNRGATDFMATLSLQGRMHPLVGDFANKHFYGGILQPIPLPHQCEEIEYTRYDKNDITERILATQRTAFIATQPTHEIELPKINSNEAKAIARFVQAYYKLQTSNGFECNPSEEIGIIVPFRNQIAMVTYEISLLAIPCSENIVIDTVERFQGSQREVILFGTTVSHPEQMEILSSPITDADGVLVDRKLNVALTRARRRMYIFGNPEILKLSPIYKVLMDELR